MRVVARQIAAAGRWILDYPAAGRHFRALMLVSAIVEGVFSFIGTVRIAAVRRNVLAAFAALSVRMVCAATQHRMHGERNQRQSLDNLGKHALNNPFAPQFWS